MADRKRRMGILNKRQLTFVLAHAGNDTDAARAAGYKNPERSAPKLMANPAIRTAIAEKQRAIIAASGARIGRRLSRLDVLERLLQLADLPPDCTRYNINGQVNALKIIADIEGYVVRRYEDLTKELVNLTPEEKEFFITHGYCENEVESRQPSSCGPEVLAQEGTGQNQDAGSPSEATGSISDPLRVGD